MYQNKKIIKRLGTLITIFACCLFLVAPAQALTPNDPLIANQWYLDQINAYGAWDISTGSNTVVVAVLDTGLDLDHPDIAGNLWTNPGEIAGDGIDNDDNGFIDDVHGWDFVDDNGDPSPDYSEEYALPGILHGTLIASVIGAVGNNGEGVAGLNWQVQLMPIRILDGLGSGSSGDATRAIDYAVANGATVINSSFSGFEADNSLLQALRRAHNNGVTVVAAVGNNESLGGDWLDEVPIYPACYHDETGSDWVIGVAATDKFDNKAGFSNYGSCVDISAPGSDIYGAQFYEPSQVEFNQEYGGGWEGTSAAAPMVAGTAALLEVMYPDLGPSEIQTVIKLSADPVAIGTDYAGLMGSGRLNVAKALEIGASFVESAITASSEPESEPSVETDKSLEEQALVYFGAFYGRMPESADDWAALHCIAYGGCQGDPRDIEAEQAALVIFGAKYAKMPEISMEWNVIHTLAYTDFLTVE
ncbi:MAG: S8 family peptidase [Candidatus Uhrbacteria bacterium]|nr:S8 family serine peptidase [Patescibacteria group bacterium]MBU1907358.1 S8 family serine peptidase [Patescibacteria group bacterium]